MKVNSIKSDRLKELWKYAYAWASFSNTIVYANRFLQIYEKVEDIDLKAFTYSIIISYARPFKQDGKLKLRNDVVRPKYRESHNFLIEMRDKVISHQDPVTTETPFGYLNQVKFHFQDKGNWLITTTHPGITCKKAKEIIDLANDLLAMCDSKIDEIFEELDLLKRLEAGKYTVVPSCKTGSGQYELKKIST